MFFPTKRNTSKQASKLLLGKSGQGSLVALVLGGVILTTIVASATR